MVLPHHNDYASIPSVAERPLPPMSVQRGLSSSSSSWGACATIPVHVLDLCFLVLLQLRLQGALDWSWLVLFSPLLITDVIFISMKAKAVAGRPTRRTGAPHVLSHDVILDVFSIIDHLGGAVAKCLLALRLEGSLTGVSITLLLLPQWGSAVVTSLLRTFPELAPVIWGGAGAGRGHAPTMTRRAPLASRGKGAAYLLSRGLQPLLVCLKVDGFLLSAPWWAVLSPAWFLAVGVAATGMFLFVAVLVGNDHGGNSGSDSLPGASAASHSPPPHVRRLQFRVVLAASMTALFISACACLFLFSLSAVLESPPEKWMQQGRRAGGASYVQILAPLIALYVTMLVTLPGLLIYGKMYRKAVIDYAFAEEERRRVERARLREQSAEEKESTAASFGATINSPAILVGEGTSLMKRASSSFCLRLGEEFGEPDFDYPAALAAASSEAAESEARLRACLACEDADGGEKGWGWWSGAALGTGYVVGDEEGEEDVEEGLREGSSLLSAPPVVQRCFICCSQWADAVIMDCGHGGLCYTCALVTASNVPQLCPVCRGPIREVRRMQRLGKTGAGVTVMLSHGGLAVGAPATDGQS